MVIFPVNSQMLTLAKVITMNLTYIVNFIEKSEGIGRSDRNTMDFTNKSI